MPRNTWSRRGSRALFTLTRYRPRARSSSTALDPDAAGLIYDIPFLAQQHANMCADASATMVLSFARSRTPIITAQVAAQLCVQPRPTVGLRIPKGMSLTDEADDLGLLQTGLPFAPSAKNVRDALRVDGPLVLTGERLSHIAPTIRGAHAVVLKGIWGNYVIIDDPWQGRDRRKPIAWLARHEAAYKSAEFAQMPDGVFSSNGVPPSDAYLRGETADPG